MWGQEILKNLGYATAGIIPTRVGTRLRLFNLNNIKQDHPHACGDKRFTIFSVNSETGSSPRVWGQVLFFFVLLFTCGIIPTRVGTSCVHCISIYTIRDHPHACGDKHRCSVGVKRIPGSSPRVWGQVHNLKFDGSFLRIIPTRVGTRKFWKRQLRRHRDHPHACGDKTIGFGGKSAMAGSSPRVWGQVSQRLLVRVQAWDHPHACGDKLFV